MQIFKEAKSFYEKKKDFFDNIFYFMFAFKYLLQFLTTTTVWVSTYGKYYSTLYHISDILLIIYIVFYLMVVLLLERMFLCDKIISIVLILVAFLYVIFSAISNNEIFEYLLITALAANKSHKKMLKITIIEGTIVMVIFMLLSQAGIIADNVMPIGRHALGMIYCTDCGAHVLFLLLSYVVYKECKVNQQIILILLFGMIFEYTIVNSKTAAICIALLLAGLLIDKYKKNMLAHIKIIMLLIYPLSLMLFVGMAYINSVFHILPHNNTFVSRLDLSITGIEKYGVSLWGRTIYQNGNGGSSIQTIGENEKLTEVRMFLLVYAIITLICITVSLVMINKKNKKTAICGTIISITLLIIPRIAAKMNVKSGNIITDSKVEYFFLDNSLINILITHGVIMMIVMLILGTIIQYKAYKKANYIYMFIMCIVALDCVMEHHMMDISYNVLFLIGLTDILKKNTV